MARRRQDTRNAQQVRDDEFIGQREKRAQALFQSGVPEKEARMQAGAQLRGEQEANPILTRERQQAEAGVRGELLSKLDQPPQEQLVLQGGQQVSPQIKEGGGFLKDIGIGGPSAFERAAAAQGSKVNAGIALPLTTMAIGAAVAGKAVAGSATAKAILGSVGLSTIGAGILKFQSGKKNDVQQLRASLRGSTTNIKMIINSLNSGIGDRYELIDAYNQELQNIDNYERALKQLANSDVKFFIDSDADVELAKIAAFNRVQRGIYDLKVREAVTMPNPNSILPEETANPEDQTQPL